VLKYKEDFSRKKMPKKEQIALETLKTQEGLSLDRNRGIA
jgi:hypothetical protein